MNNRTATIVLGVAWFLAVICVTVLQEHRLSIKYCTTTPTTTLLLFGDLSQSQKIETKRDMLLLGNNKSKETILVLYTGPSNKKSVKLELYQRNFEYFLDYGVDCEHQDTVLVVGYDFFDEYVDRVETLNLQCQRTYGHKVILITRRDKCYDMESVYLLFHGGVPGVNVNQYDYFFYINCGVTGPGVPNPTTTTTKPWTSYFKELLDERVKMTGLSLNCNQPDSHVAHMQSMMYGLDRKGVELVKESGAIYDCLEKESQDFINEYERKMSIYILNRGYSLRSYAQRNFTLTANNRQNCTLKDMWLTKSLHAKYGRLPSLEELIFHKTSRVLTEEIAKKINHTWPKPWGDW